MCLAGLWVEGVVKVREVSSGGKLLCRVKMVWRQMGLFWWEGKRRGKRARFTLLNLLFTEGLCQGAEVPVQVPEILDRAVGLWLSFLQVLCLLNMLLGQLMLLQYYLPQHLEFVILKILHQHRLRGRRER